MAGVDNINPAHLFLLRDAMLAPSAFRQFKAAFWRLCLNWQ